MIEEKKPQTVHNLILEARKSLSVSGVSDVDSFDDRQVGAFTDMGYLTIKGSNLHINQFNTRTGELSLSGKIDELIYSNEEKRTAQGFISKLFN